VGLGEGPVRLEILGPARVGWVRFLSAAPIESTTWTASLPARKSAKQDLELESGGGLPAPAGRCASTSALRRGILLSEELQVAKSVRVLLTVSRMTFGSMRTSAATITVFPTPTSFSGQEILIQFDGIGLPSSSEFRSLGGVGFSLVELGTLIDTGFGPTVASAPDSTYAREFPPRNGPIFLNTINPRALDVDLAIDFPVSALRVAAEIRSGQTLNDVRDLTFELYRQTVLIAQTTLLIRGQNDFLFYGLESSVGFDRWVIRQRPDSRFGLENLRYEEIPEPATVMLTVVGLAGLLVRGRAARSSHPLS